MTSENKYSDEIWSDIAGFSHYSISTYGRVISKEHVTYRSDNKSRHFETKFLKLTLSKGRDESGGYYQVRLRDENNIARTYSVHRLVAQTFIPNPENKATVNHKNGIKTDNRVDNLEWATYSENNVHAYQCSLKTDNKRVVAVNSTNDKIIDFYYSISDASRNINITRKKLSQMLESGDVFKNIKIFSAEDFIKYFNKNKQETLAMNIKVKYFDKEIDKITNVEGKSDWFDLRAAETVELKAGEYKLIPLGIGMILPDGYEANIVPRSSTFKNYGIIQTNHYGVIDNSYSGDNDQWRFPAYATRDTIINKNDRICQFRINKKQPTFDFEEVGHLNKTDRGGFGSTGTK